jgi:hypothetical protein
MPSETFQMGNRVCNHFLTCLRKMFFSTAHAAPQWSLQDFHLAYRSCLFVIIDWTNLHQLYVRTE